MPEMTIDANAADLFERCRKVIGAVEGYPPLPNNAETMKRICTRFLETAGVII